MKKIVFKIPNILMMFFYSNAIDDVNEIDDNINLQNNSPILSDVQDFDCQSYSYPHDKTRFR